MATSSNVGAFVDESHYERDSTGHFYTMTAAVISFSQRDPYAIMMDRLEQIAHDQPDHSIHANKMPGRYDRELGNIQAAIVASPAVRLVMTVRTFLGDVRSDEDARQVCLADLACRLNELGPLQRLVLDSRDPMGGASKAGRPRRGGLNERDMVTLNDLREAGQFSVDTKVQHADDRLMRPLWIPDVAGYVISRSIARQDPGYMSILADKVEIHEATVLPLAMRRPGHTSLEPSVLEVALQDHVAVAAAIGHGIPVPPSLIPVVKEREGRPPRPRIDDESGVSQPTVMDVLLNRTPQITHPTSG